MTALVTQVFKDNIEFNILLNNGDFLESQSACQELIPPANVASFTSAEEYNFILDAISKVEDPLQFAWIGLQRPEESNLNSQQTAEAYQFIDGTPNVFTNEPFVFPWASDEPTNNVNTEFCAAISINLDAGEFGTLDDTRCNKDDGGQATACKSFLSTTATQIAADETFQITVLTLPENTDSFDDGIAACAALDPPGELASFSNENEFNFIVETIQLVPPFDLAWVGLRRGPDEEGVDASDFEFLDGTSNAFTSFGNQFPWAEDEPNNANGNQECGCISYTFDQPNTLEDIQCNGQNSEPSGAVCKQFLTVSPTESPTKNPTTSPTNMPTNNPATSPTTKPTNTPTTIPSAPPTGNTSSEQTREVYDGILIYSFLFIFIFLLLIGLMVLLALKMRQRKKICLLLSGK